MAPLGTWAHIRWSNLSRFSMINIPKLRVHKDHTKVLIETRGKISFVWSKPTGGEKELNVSADKVYRWLSIGSGVY